MSQPALTIVCRSCLDCSLYVMTVMLFPLLSNTVCHHGQPFYFIVLPHSTRAFFFSHMVSAMTTSTLSGDEDHVDLSDATREEDESRIEARDLIGIFYRVPQTLTALGRGVGS